MSCSVVDFDVPFVLRSGSTALLCFNLTSWLSGQATSIESVDDLSQEGDGEELTIDDKAVVGSGGFLERDGTVVVEDGKGVQATFACETPGVYFVLLTVTLNNAEVWVFRQRVEVR